MRPVDWLWAGDRPDWPRVLLVALGVATLVAIVVVASTQTAAFGPYNPGRGPRRFVARHHRLPDDVKTLARPMLVHRLVLSTDADLSDVTTA